MIRMARLTDYGVMLLVKFAQEPAQVRSARELSEKTGVPLPTASKILKLLAHNKLLIAHRGVKGGFSLSRSPRQITLAEILQTLEGPVALTECGSEPKGCCTLESGCEVGANLRHISGVILRAMRGISLEDLTRPLAENAPNVHLRFGAAAAPGGTA